MVISKYPRDRADSAVKNILLSREPLYGVSERDL